MMHISFVIIKPTWQLSVYTDLAAAKYSFNG